MIDISNVVNVVISSAESGLGNYNVNAFLYLTSESPVETWTTQYRVYRNAVDVATDFGSNAQITKNAQTMFKQDINFLSGNGYLIVAPIITQEIEGADVTETLSEALTRVSKLIYFGGWCSDVMDESEVEAVASLNETMDCIYFVESNDSEDLGTGGIFETLANAGYDKTKLLYHGEDSDMSFLSAYVARAMSTNFSAQNSASTMNLKSLKGVSEDKTINETMYLLAKGLGVDVYSNIGGVEKVSSNPNKNGEYFDNVYNRLWFKQAMKVAIFNALARTNTKIPQTEEGMDYLKRSARAICQQAVYNGFLAPGTWNGEYTFGYPQDFARNISDFGYYIYSLPISEQSQSEREERKAPVIQIACKESGAIHSASIIVTFEA